MSTTTTGISAPPTSTQAAVTTAPIMDSQNLSTSSLISPMAATSGFALTPDLSKVMKPPRLDILPSAIDANRVFKHWRFIFKGFVEHTSQNKLVILATCVSHEVFELIQECTSFDEAMRKLESAYIKPKSEIIARFNLQNLKQAPEEKISDYLIKLETLSLQCEFKSVSAEEYRKDLIRYSFIAGLQNNAIRTRLLENTSLTLDEAVTQARALELAIQDSKQYSTPSSFLPGGVLGAVNAKNAAYSGPSSNGPRKPWVCYCCGGKNKHPRGSCPAREAKCGYCNVVGHYQAVCRSKPKTLAATAGSKSTVDAAVNGAPCKALLDTGSQENFLDENFARENEINIIPYSTLIKLAHNKGQQCFGIAYINVCFLDKNYKIRVIIMKNLITDLILGDPWFKVHREVIFKCGGSQPALTVAALRPMVIDPPRLFPNLGGNIKPIATKSRKYTQKTIKFLSQMKYKLF